MHTRRELLQGVAVAAVASRMGGMIDPPPVSVPRKVVLIKGDDIGRDLCTPTKMPRTCALAARGMWFWNHWAAALCSIDRARALTGCESIRPQNCTGENVPHTSSFAGPAGPWITHDMPGTKTLRGKWHRSGTNWPSCIVGTNRFDAYSGSHANLSAGGTSYYAWTKGTADATGYGFGPCTTFATNDTYADASADIANGVEYVQVEFNAVHAPNLAAPPDQEPPGTIYNNGGVDAYLWHLDYRIEQLAEQAIAAGYVVIVTFDNGSAATGKGTYSDEGLNTPLFAVGQGVPVGTSDRLIQGTDLFATIRELRGAPYLPAPDSCSFADAIVPGFPGSTPRAYMTCSSYTSGLGLPPVAGTVTRAAGETRYMLVDDAGIVKFYDRQLDPKALTPITPTSPREVAAYQALLAALPA